MESPRIPWWVHRSPHVPLTWLQAEVAITWSPLDMIIYSNSA